VTASESGWQWIAVEVAVTAPSTEAVTAPIQNGSDRSRGWQWIAVEGGSDQESTVEVDRRRGGRTRRSRWH